MSLETERHSDLKLSQRIIGLLSRSEKCRLAGVLSLTLATVAFEALGFGAVFAVIALVVGSERDLIARWLPDLLANLSRSSQVSVTMTVLVLVFIAKHVISLVGGWFQQGIMAKISARLGKHLFAVYMAKPYSFFTNHGTPELFIKSQNASLISNAFLTPIVTLTSDLLVGLALISLLLIVEVQVTLITILLFFSVGLISHRLLRSRIETWGSVQVNLRTAILREIQEAFSSIKELRVMSRGELVLSRYGNRLTEMAKINQRFLAAQAIPRAFLETLAVIGISLMVVFLTAQGRQGDEILPILGLFAAGAFRIMPAVNRVILALQQLRLGRPLVNEIIDDLEADFPSPRVVRPTGHTYRFQKLTFDGISFQYGTDLPLILDGFSAEVEAGESLGIVGESGVGKSTLVDIALGLQDPTAGKVFLNGESLSSRLGEWHKIVGYVPQSVFLVDATVRENVCLGLAESDIDETKVWGALRSAQLEDFIRTLPDGLQTVVGERGIRFSGGQRQRLGIARAIYHSPDVLFFDEATSSLDDETESALLDAVDNLRKSVTIIFVTHRTSTLRVCSRVITLRR